MFLAESGAIVLKPASLRLVSYAAGMIVSSTVNKDGAQNVRSMDLAALGISMSLKKHRFIVNLVFVDCGAARA